jgi:filamentous hemagglutinin family protein
MRLIQGGIVGITIGVWAMGSSAIAQIVPDGTLGAERSVVVNIGTRDLIGGGAVRGRNLFHSFQDFNIGVDRSAYFIAPSTIVQNILARVTGRSYSEISGVLGVARQQANGRLLSAPNANLFLINPNGIIFSEGARLDIGGSFLATTANSVGFGDLGEFSATNTQLPSALLTINPTAFFVNQVNPQIIAIDQGQLRVRDGKNISLLAGNVFITGASGGLATYGGHVDIAAVASPTTVGFTSNGNLIVSEGVERGGITLTDAARIDVIDESVSGGSIRLTAKDILIVDRSRVVAGTYRQFGNTESRSGDIILDASNKIIVDNGFIRNRIQNNALGNTGNILVNAKNLVVNNGGSLANRIAGKGNSGAIIITAGEVTINGTFGGNYNDENFIDNENFTGIATILESSGVGNLGGITIKTDNLYTYNGGRVFSKTNSTGNSGNISLKANNSIYLSGTTQNEDPGRTIPSGISSETYSVTNGNSGNLTIETNALYVNDGATISTSSFGKGNSGNVDVIANDIFLFGEAMGGGTPSGFFSSIASKDAVSSGGGNLNVTTTRLFLVDGATIATGTFGRGNAGNIRITANESIVLTGKTSDGTPSRIDNEVKPTGIGNSGNIFIKTDRLFGLNGASISTSTVGNGNAGNVNIEANRVVLKSDVLGDYVNTRILSAVLQGGKGSGGDVNIRTGSLLLSTGSLVSTSSLGDGPAGNIDISAKTIRLYFADILSDAFSVGNGANIRINSDLLLLRLNSNISTTAGANGFGGDGGNININSKFIIAVPKENSDIAANAFQGKGGQVLISTQGLFGITPLSRSNDKLSDITASSDLGVQGTVAINQPNIRPEQGLNELPTGLVDPASRISKECPRGYTDRPMGRFIITGKGGLPTSPIAPSSTSLPLPPLISSPEDTAIGRADRPQIKAAEPIVEAQGFARDRDGQVQLVAQSAGGNTPIVELHCYANK